MNEVMNGGARVGPGDAPPVEMKLLENRARFVAFLARKTGSRDLAEEILQGAYAQVLERGAPPVGDEGMVAWFQAVLRNAWIDRLRHQEASARALASTGWERETIDGPELQQEICRCLGDALEALKPEYAGILREVDLAEVPPAEVARRSGMTPSNARVRLHRARAALRAQLGRLCGACAVHGCLDCRCRGAGAERPGP